MKNSDTGSGLFLVVLGIAGVVYTRMQGFRSTVGLSPAFFPTFLFVAIGICGLILTLKSFKLEKAGFPKFKWGKLAAIIGMLAVYIVVMDYIGFIISTIVFLLASMWFYGETRIKIIVPVSLVATAIIYLLWTFVFNIPLPTLFL
ncbi:MAG: tripartite tricarboxylate transporter TctB family protein [Firmicutes bacterium]|nr:tripartite tricarboxylate transporter TctB family protein [Bacillota bacterium]